jgi:CHAT domain-containing protein
MTKYNLGAAYLYRIRGERADNLEQAITACHDALRVLTCEAFPQQWAMTKNNLGNAYNQRVEGRRADNLEQAITAFNDALQVLTCEAFPQQWAATKNNLGSAYLYRIRGERADNLEQAITACHDALRVLTCEAFPQQWAMTKNNLGNAYLYRIRGERADNLEQAITACHDALKVYTRSAFPQDWSMTKINLGNAYIDRIRGERADNLEQAITAFNDALQVLTCEAFPRRWAMNRNNLGNAYSERIQGERAKNLEEAICAYDDALKVYTREASPHDWATIKNNLGNTYRQRIRGEPADNLEKAISSCYDALQVLTREAFPQQWATIKHNLGNTYRQRIRGERADNLEEAISAYNDALKVYTREASPHDWAMTRMPLGDTYRERIIGEQEKNLEEAISACYDALQVLTRKAFPRYWAIAKITLAGAYLYRIKGERTDNLEEAISACYDALQVLTREAFPIDYARTQYSLGLTYQESEQIEETYHAFAASVETIEFLRGEIAIGSGVAEDKQKLAAEWNDLYQRLVAVCLILGYQEEALEYVERAKTRGLSEQLATRDLFPEGEIPEALRQQLQQLRQQIDEERCQLGDKPASSRLVELRQQYNEHYPYQPLRFEQIRELIEERTAIVEWYISSDCFRAFLVTRTNEVCIWTSSREDRENLIEWGNNEYLAPYKAIEQAGTEAEQEQRRQQWQDNFENRLKQLTEILHVPELLAKLPEGIEQLILVPHRFLHQFPLHALPLPNGDYLIDRFPRGIRYTPSCQLLHRLQQRSRDRFDNFFAIQTPTPDLYETDLGTVSAIKQQFAQPKILKKSRATKTAILDTGSPLNTTNCLLFFCHGSFQVANPLDSGLRLADEVLTLEDIIARLDLSNCRLVVLSACETGLATFEATDDYTSLPAGFLLAGSTNVIGSLWTVGALPTALLMLRFFQVLKERDGNIVIAMSIAQRWLRDTTTDGFREWLKDSPMMKVWKKKSDRYFSQLEASERPFNNPSNWAAFCAIGKGV